MACGSEIPTMQSQMFDPGHRDKDSAVFRSGKAVIVITETGRGQFVVTGIFYRDGCPERNYSTRHITSRLAWQYGHDN